MESALQILSNTRKPWLLILDNADDPDFDYQVYLPSGTHGSVIMTSRVSECSHYNTVGFEQLNGLDVEDSTELLLKAARKPRQSWHSYQQQAKDIVELLGSHTLALIQAGAYIAAQHCELDKYHEEYKKQRKRLLKFRPKQAKSRYQDVYATFEASASILTDDALELLEIISMLHWGLLPLEIFHSAWKGSELVRMNDNEDTEIGPCDLSQWHVLQLPVFIAAKDKYWDPFRLNEAVSLLASLSLITQDASFGISMHPLTHAWAKDRQESIDQAWIKTGSVIVLSSQGSDIWRTDQRFLLPHVHSYIIPELYTVLYKRELKVLPFLLVCAFIFSISGDYNRSAILTQHLLRIIVIDPDHLSSDFLEIYKLSAWCHAALGNTEEGIEQLESVLEIAVSALRKDDICLLSSQHYLARMYSKIKQYEKAIELFEILLNFKGTLPENNSDRLVLEQELARAYLKNNEVGRAINLFKHVVKIKEANLPESHPDRLSSQYELARGYLANNQVDEAIELFTHVLSIEKPVSADDHISVIRSEEFLASAYRKCGQTGKAIPLLEHVIKVRGRTLVEESGSRLNSEYVLATAYRENGQVDKAIPLLEHVLRVQESTLAVDDSTRLHTEYNLAIAYVENRRVDEGTELLKHILRVQESTLAEDNPFRIITEHALAYAYLQAEAAHDTDKAVENFGHIFTTERKTLAEEDPTRLSSQHVLALACLKAGQAEKAFKILEHASNVRQRTLAVDHPSLLGVQNIL